MNRLDYLILGMGVTGMSVARYLHADKKSFIAIDNSEFSRDLLTKADTLVLSPGISRKTTAVKQVEDAGVSVIGDIELFARAVKKRAAKVVAITGTNGKSTVTDLLTQMALDCGIKAQAGGNIGTPALDLLQDDDIELFVLELSSFQLESTYSLRCDVGCVLNISADHLDRYDDLTEYANAKRRLVNQAKTMVLWRDDPVLQTWKLPQKIKRLEFSADAKIGEIKLAGKHNRLNAAAALAIGRELGLSSDKMLQTVKSYPGLEHRTFLVRELDGVKWINDSKGTNPGAVAAALEGLAEDRNIILLAGGQSKGADFTPLATVADKHVKQAWIFGEDGKKLMDVLPRSSLARNMEDAVYQARKRALAGDVVLLSPGCASFDMFADYKERGRVFTKIVEEMG